MHHSPYFADFYFQALDVMSLALVQTPRSELEVEVQFEATASLPDAGLLLVHPYSVLGGSMFDAVVSETYR